VPDPVAEAQELLVDTIETLEKLEVVRLLVRQEPRTIDALTTELGLPPTVTRDALRELEARGVLCEESVGWRLDPRSSKRDAVFALVQLYDQDRLGVLNRMTKIALERIRANAARTFADAFVVRTRKKDED
jgi:DNA-binding GntR family transcriptional regulator